MTSMARTTAATPLCLVVAMLSLAGTGCNDNTAQPTAPEAAQAVVRLSAGVGKDHRTPYIANLEFPSGPIVRLDEPYRDTPYFVTLANPGPKTATGLFFHGYLEQDGLTESVGATFPGCYEPPGTLPPRAPCTQAWFIRAVYPPQFALGPALFRLKLMQRTIDNKIKELDSVTVDVVIHY